VSYILDALKKAESDRDPDTRARIAFEAREQRRNRFITYAVLAALIANAVLLLWVFLPDNILPGISEPVPPESVLEKATHAPSHATTEPSPAAAEPPPQQAATAVVQTSAPAAVKTPPPTSKKPVAMAPDEVLIGPGSQVSSGPASLSSLPEAVRRRFPSLSFSTHIYAEEPDLRAVVVNGRRLVEGDALGALTLERITEDGAVFLFEGRQVEVDVLEDWN